MVRSGVPGDISIPTANTATLLDDGLPGSVTTSTAQPTVAHDLQPLGMLTAGWVP